MSSRTSKPVPPAMPQLNGTHSGQLANAIQVGVHENARVADERDRNIALVHLSTLVGPGIVGAAHVLRAQVQASASSTPTRT